MDAPCENRRGMGWEDLIWHLVYGDFAACVLGYHDCSQQRTFADCRAGIPYTANAGRTGFGSGSLICNFAVADSVLSVLTAAHRYISHDIASYGELCRAVGGMVASFFLYAAAGRDYRKADVHPCKDPSQRAGGTARQYNIHTRIAGLERAAYGNRCFCFLVPAPLAGRPKVV